MVPAEQEVEGVQRRQEQKEEEREHQGLPFNSPKSSSRSYPEPLIRSPSERAARVHRAEQPEQSQIPRALRVPEDSRETTVGILPLDHSLSGWVV